MVTAEDGRSDHILDTLQNCNLKDFVDGLDAGCERKRSQGYLQDFCPEKMKGWNYYVLSGVDCWRNSFKGKIKIPGLGMLSLRCFC